MPLESQHFQVAYLTVALWHCLQESESRCELKASQISGSHNLATARVAPSQAGQAQDLQGCRAAGAQGLGPRQRPTTCLQFRAFTARAENRIDSVVASASVPSKQKVVVHDRRAICDSQFIDVAHSLSAWPADSYMLLHDMKISYKI